MQIAGMFQTIVWIALGGAAGSVCRYLNVLLVQRYFHSPFPLPTLCVNLIGCFLMGLLIGVLQKNPDSGFKFFLMTGFLGAYTTFSAFANENIQLLLSGQYFSAAAYIFSSLFGGLLLTFLGFLLTRGGL